MPQSSMNGMNPDWSVKMVFKTTQLRRVALETCGTPYRTNKQWIAMGMMRQDRLLKSLLQVAVDNMRTGRYTLYARDALKATHLHGREATAELTESQQKRMDQIRMIRILKEAAQIQDEWDQNAHSSSEPAKKKKKPKAKPKATSTTTTPVKSKVVASKSRTSKRKAVSTSKKGKKNRGDPRKSSKD